MNVYIGAAVMSAIIAVHAVAGSGPATVKSDRIADAFALVSTCSTAAWPKVPAECVEHPDGVAGYRVPVRTVTVEKRDEANRTSVLIRMPR